MSMYRRRLLASASLTVSALVSMVLPITADANPTGGQVVAGVATITTTSPQVLTINQQTGKAIIDWRTFSIAAGETTEFNQPNASSISLNRVTGGDPSQILGNLTSNGQVWLVNPNGIVFGKSARVDVAGLLATTLDITNQDFLAGNYRFAATGAAPANITNAGHITIRNAGLAALVAPGVENSGVITARLGRIQLTSADGFTVDFYGDGKFNFLLSQAVSHSLASGAPVGVTNNGSLIADGGQILLTAQAAKSVVDQSINMTGYIEARTVGTEGGVITLDGGTQGAVSVTGIIDASGTSAGQAGGTVSVTGQSVNLGSTAMIDASGDVGGGTVRIGGDLHGAGPLRNATTTSVVSGALITADALTSGSGGQVVVWANDQTSFYGAISARGGTQSGNGGSAEVSGHRLLDFTGSVDLRATMGTAGELLLDPENVTIAATGATPAVSGGAPIILNPTADDSVIQASTLEHALSLASVTVTTGTTGVQAGDISVASNVSWSSGNSLTLSAHRNVVVNDGVTIANTGSGNLVLRADSDGVGVGTVSFGTTGSGKIDFSGSTGSVSIFYNPADNPVGGTLTTFFDTFNRPDGVVGNGWTDAPDNTPSNLIIQSGALTTPGSVTASVYRGIDQSGAVTVSADLGQQNGFGGLLRRYTTTLSFGNSGTANTGYGLVFYRGDQNYADSAVILTYNGQTIAALSSSFQYGAAIHTTFTVMPNGDVNGIVTGDGNSFAFDFGVQSLHSLGPDFAIRLNGGDARSPSLTNSTVQNLSIIQYGGAYTAPTDFSPHVLTNAAAPRQLTGYMLVNTATNLQDMENNLSANFALGRNIDASATGSWNGGSGFVPVGDLINPFTGTLDGLGHSVDHLTINSAATRVGFFGYVGATGTIRNINLTSLSVTGTFTSGTLPFNPIVHQAYTNGGQLIGGLAGQNDGTITNASVSGSVAASSWGLVGGLVGWNQGIISQTFTLGSVSDSPTILISSEVGGLVADNEGSIADSYSRASVSGAAGQIGGLVGVFSGLPASNPVQILRSYAAGPVTITTGPAGGLVDGAVGSPTITNSYWDTQVTGQAISAGGTPQTTAQLKAGLPIGFDAGVWAIDPAVNGGYPYLRSNPASPPASAMVNFGNGISSPPSPPGDQLLRQFLNFTGNLFPNPLFTIDDTTPATIISIFSPTGSPFSLPLVPSTTSTSRPPATNQAQIDFPLKKSAAGVGYQVNTDFLAYGDGTGTYRSQYKPNDLHLGVDLQASRNDAVFAPVSGSIVYYHTKGNGFPLTDSMQTFIVLLGDDGRSYILGHTRCTVCKGSGVSDSEAYPADQVVEHVIRGSQIGVVEDLGHLHFGINSGDIVDTNGTLKEAFRGGAWGDSHYGLPGYPATPEEAKSIAIAAGWIDPLQATYEFDH